MTRRPRRWLGRGFGLTLAPLRIYSAQDPANSGHPTNSFTDAVRQWWPVIPTRFPKFTTQAPHSAPLSDPVGPTASPTESTTSWWPPGVKLGPRPTRPYLPFHVINPKELKWERKFPKIWFRTGGTRFTYAPEVLNYPVTFNWSVPRDMRVDKYTARPDWPLDSPLFGSQQVYDYLDDVSLPPPPVSGETEYPPTSPEPWWTYPPWWEEKIASEVNGTTARPPYTFKIATHPSPTTILPLTTSTKLSATKPITTIKDKMEITTVPKSITIKQKSVDKLPSHLTTTHLIPDLIPKQTPGHISEKVIHHEGPWWKFTIIQHLPQTTSVPEAFNSSHKRIKRLARHFRPLVRQNAIRRKHYKRQWNKKLTDQFNFPLSKKALIKKHELSHLSENLLEKMLRSAVHELSELIEHRVKVSSSKKDWIYKEDTNIDKETALKNEFSTIHNHVLLAFRDFTQEKKNKFVYDLVTSEIVENIQRTMLSQTSQIKVFFEQNKKSKDKNKSKKITKTKHSSKVKVFKLIQLFWKHNLMSSKEIHSFLQFLINIFKEIRPRVHEDHLEISSKESFPRFKREGNNIDFNKSLNLSAQSMERIVDELVDEIPMNSLNQEVKTDLVAELHTNRLNQLGKSNVNKEVISKMAEFESDSLKIDQMTLNPVKQVITCLLNEVLATLRKHEWMKNVMVKLFEEGYSVDSVVETIAKQISIESLLKSMEDEGVNITQSQKGLILSEFKGYKSMLHKMLKNEVLLWEHQLTKTQTLIRQKRNSSSKNCRSNYNNYFQTALKQSHLLRDLPFLQSSAINNVQASRKRDKRNIDNINLSAEIKNMQYGKYETAENQLNIDRELSDIEKSSMSDGKKIKKLKKHLKWLKSQTENPAEIVFPDNFEEELMKTGSYEEEKVKQPRIPKKRYQWNVRTRKPTLKVFTFLPKIRLTRGKPFIPLTTTEERLEIPETQPPTRKKRTNRPIPAKRILDPTSVTTLQMFKKNFWLDFTQKPLAPKISSRVRASQRPRLLRKRTAAPKITFATVKTFPTMKFGKNTQQPIISLQEFLKRRDEFRRVRDEGMWHRNFKTSSEQGTEMPFTKSISEEEDKLSEEEELEFDAKLSAEVNPSVFTLRPMSDFLYLKVETTSKHGDSTTHPSMSPLRTKSVTRRLRGSKTVSRSKGTKKFTKKTGYTKVPHKGTLKTHNKVSSKTVNSPISCENQSRNNKENEVISAALEGNRTKRDLLASYNNHPITTEKSGKVSDF